MNEGDIFLYALRQADGKIKKRPVLLLRQMPPYDDWLTCGISSQLRHEVEGFDEMIAPTDSDFARSGLKMTSLIRLGFLAIITDAELGGRIGKSVRAAMRDC